MILGNYGSTLLSYAYKPFGESSQTHDPISDDLLTWAASIGSGIVNGIARFTFGNLADKYSFRRLMSIILSVELLTCILFYWAANVPALYFTCVLLNYGVLGGIYAIFPVSVTHVYGLEKGPLVYVQVLIGSFLSSLLNLFATKWILPISNYGTLFMIGALVTVVSIVVVFFIKEELDLERLQRKGVVE